MTRLGNLATRAALLMAFAVAGPAFAQLGGAEPSEVAELRAGVVAACNKAANPGGPERGMAFSWFRTDRARRILDFPAAVAERSNALRTGLDRLTTEVDVFKQHLERTVDLQRRHPTSLSAGPDAECLRQYIALVSAMDAPSWQVAREEAAKASAAKIEAQRQAQEARQIAADQASAERAKQEKEAAAAQAQADHARRQHEEATAETHRQSEEAAAAEQQRREAAAAEATRKWDAERAARLEQERPAREAAAEAARKVAAAELKEAERLPACADAGVLGAVKSAVAKSPAGVSVGLRVVGIENIVQSILDAKRPQRYCYATMMTTGGTTRGTYSIRWMGKPGGEVWVETELR